MNHRIVFAVTLFGIAQVTACGGSSDGTVTESDSGVVPDDTGASAKDTGGDPIGDTSSSSDVASPTDTAVAGKPVTVEPTTMTAPIPTVQKCSGTTYGSNGDLPAINTPVFVDTTKVDSLILRYDMGYYFGEPTRRAVVSWEGSGALSSVQWLGEVQDPDGRQYVTGGGKRVYASYLVGSIKAAGAGFGIDSTGSPSWGQTFVTYDNTAGVQLNTVTETEAKNIYKGCFKLANIRLLKLNGKGALQP